MKTAIQQRALELGFDDCRFTTAAAPAHTGPFQDWLASGQHGEMAWLARNAEKRVDPQRVLPGAQTIVTLATSYHQTTGTVEPSLVARVPPHPAPLPEREGEWSPVLQPAALAHNSGLGVIARYSRYTDYHDVLAGVLKELTAYITWLGVQSGLRETKSLWYVDTGPLLERDLAERAGLGFAGKHTNLINRRLGNWFFLSEIITTAAIAPDAPEKNHCGSCTRCLAACPTNAITAPFQLDARRCISYLTIELKGSIPVELRPALGNRIYGCDDCLAVCPWNRFAREGQMMKAHARADLAQPDLLALLTLNDAGFKQRFAGTPILRTKRRGLLRNVCVALGNMGTRAALPPLARAAHDAEPLIAEHAHWAIGQIEGRLS
jgi:epoxyqueuosine reductase